MAAPNILYFIGKAFEHVATPLQSWESFLLAISGRIKLLHLNVIRDGLTCRPASSRNGQNKAARIVTAVHREDSDHPSQEVFFETNEKRETIFLIEECLT